MSVSLTCKGFSIADVAPVLGGNIGAQLADRLLQRCAASDSPGPPTPSGLSGQSQTDCELRLSSSHSQTRVSLSSQSAEALTRRISPSASQR